MPVNLENINMLISHYQQGGGVPDWGWENCVGGVLEQKGLVRIPSGYGVSEALGIDFAVASRLVYGITFAGYDPRSNKLAVLRALASIRDTGDFVWDTSDVGD